MPGDTQILSSSCERRQLALGEWVQPQQTGTGGEGISGGRGHLERTASGGRDGEPGPLPSALAEGALQPCVWLLTLSASPLPGTCSQHAAAMPSEHADVV